MFLFRCASAASPEITGLAAFFLRRHGGAEAVKVSAQNISGFPEIRFANPGMTVYFINAAR